MVRSAAIAAAFSAPQKCKTTQPTGISTASTTTPPLHPWPHNLSSPSFLSLSLSIPDTHQTPEEEEEEGEIQKEEKEKTERGDIGTGTMGSRPGEEEEEAAAAEMRRIFGKFDANGDGKISSAELGDVLRTLGAASPEEVQRMMAEIDTDGDGCIDFGEFAAFYRANRGLMKDVGKVF